MGYKDPPDGSKFKPGQSGNPKGRPVGAVNRSTVVKKWLAVKEKAVNPITKKTQNLTQEDLITLVLINQARKGNVRAYKELLDSCYGKPPQSMEFFGAVTDVGKSGSAEETRAALDRIQEARAAFQAAKTVPPKSDQETHDEGQEPAT